MDLHMFDESKQHGYISYYAEQNDYYSRIIKKSKPLSLFYGCVLGNILEHNHSSVCLDKCNYTGCPR